MNRLISNYQLKMILRAAPSGSFTIRQSLSQIMVLFVSGSVGSQAMPGMLGLPVAAKAAQEEAIFFASACASGVLPVPCSQRFVLSKQNCSSAVLGPGDEVIDGSSVAPDRLAALET